jgi:hypothetical protein
MAVVITENRTLVDEADSATGWTGSASVSVTTSDPDPVEASGSLGMPVGESTDDLYHTITSADLSNTMVYVWALPLGTMELEANGGVAVVLGDGTNRIGFHRAGSDVAGFRHESGPVGWQCLLIDTSNYPASGNTVLAGSAASLNVEATTQVGSMFTTLSKALGGADNCFTDIIRYGNDGITVGGGNTTAQGTFSDIATADRSTANVTAYGILRELNAQLFGCQGPISFGDSSGTTSTHFEDTNFTVAFEDREIATNKYYINIIGNSTGNNYFRLGTISGTENGQDGGSIIVPSGVGSSFDASDVNVNWCLIYDTSLTGFTEGMIFSSDATTGPQHDVFDCSFIGCDIVDPGRVDFKNNTIAASSNATGSFLLPANTDLLDSLNFNSDGTGHAIYVNPTGAGPFTYALSDFNFSGFASSNGTTGNEAIYIDPVTSTANITFNVTDGSGTLSFREAAGYTGTITINNDVAITLTGLQVNTEVRVFDAGTTDVVDGIEDVTGNNAFTFSKGSGSSVDIRMIHVDYKYKTILGYVIPGTATSVPVEQEFDRNYENPV